MNKIFQYLSGIMFSSFVIYSAAPPPWENELSREVKNLSIKQEEDRNILALLVNKFEEQEKQFFDLGDKLDTILAKTEKNAEDNRSILTYLKRAKDYSEAGFRAILDMQWQVEKNIKELTKTFECNIDNILARLGRIESYIQTTYSNGIAIHNSLREQSASLEHALNEMNASNETDFRETNANVRQLQLKVDELNRKQNQLIDYLYAQKSAKTDSASDTDTDVDK